MHSPESSIQPEILTHESNAIKNIEKYLLEGYENRLEKAKSEEIDMLSSPITYQLEFWSYVEKAFFRYFSKVDNYYTKLFTPPPRGSKARNIRLGSDVYWYDPIEELKASFEEIEAMYLYNNSHHPRCKQLFSKLTDEIMAAIYTVKKDNVPYILGRVHFNHIDKMLNLADKQIVALLPFLLTAYVYNFRQNKFMSVGTVAVERAFTIDGILEENITSKNDNDTRVQLKKLSTRFGFEKSTINFSDVKAEEKEPSASTIIDEEDTRASVFRPSKYPSLQNKTMMDLVFAVWCVIFIREAQKTGPVRKVLINEGHNTVDFKLCYELYLYYTDKKQYGQYNGSGKKDHSTDSIFRNLERLYNTYRF